MALNIQRFPNVCQRFRPATEDEWDTISAVSEVSQYAKHGSCNTGFTGGTGDFAGGFSRHARIRMLERDVNRTLICHTVARGHKRDAGNGRYVFEKDGVVIISSSASPDMQVITAWFQSGWMQETKDAQAELAQIIDALDAAIDSESRLEVLCQQLGDRSEPDSWRIFQGVDLLERPPECPLLQRCARYGYDECVKQLLHKGFSPGVTIFAKDMCSILHFAAWGGHSQIIEVLRSHPDSAAHFSYLLKSRNNFGEMPENTAFGQYLAKSFSDGVESSTERFAAFAVLCAQERVHDPTLSVQLFVEQAGKKCQTYGSSSPLISIPPGTSVDVLVDHLTSLSHARCGDFHVSHVRLEDSAFSSILQLLASNFNLEVLSIQRCGLLSGSIACVSHFLSTHTGQLLDLDLSYNRLGDEGVRMLSGEHLVRLQSLLLSGVDMTCTGLAALSGKLRGNPLGAQLAKLRVNENNFSELSPSMSEFEEFVSFLAEPRSVLRYIDLRNTRLTPSQVRAFVASLRTSAVEVVELHKVGLPADVANVTAGNPLLRALRDPACNLKKLSISDLEYPSLAREVKSVIKARVKKQPLHGLSTVAETSVSTLMSSSTRAQKSCAIELRGSTVARLYQLEDMMPGQPVSAVLKTRWGTLDHVKDGDSHFSPADVGQAFALGFRLDREHGARLRVTEKTETPDVTADFLISAHIVFHRRDTHQVLLVSKNNTLAGTKLLGKLQKYVFPQHLDAEAHSSQTLKKAHTVRCNFDQLMHGTDVHAFSDEEVFALSHFDIPEHFNSFQGRYHSDDMPQTTLGKDDLLDKLRGEAVFVALQKCFSDEFVYRKQVQLQVPHNTYDFPGSGLNAKPAFGKADDVWTFGSIEEEVIQEVLKTNFSGPVELRSPGGSTTHAALNLASVDVFDAKRRWYQRLILCEVPSEMIDPFTSNPFGLCCKAHHKRYPPMWVDISESSLAGMVNTSADISSQSMLLQLTELVAMHVDETRVCLEFRRKTVGPHLPRSGKDSCSRKYCQEVDQQQQSPQRTRLQLKPRTDSAPTRPACGTDSVQPENSECSQADQRPRLQLKPRSQPLSAANESVHRDPKIFGDQRS